MDNTCIIPIDCQVQETGSRKTVVAQSKLLTQRVNGQPAHRFKICNVRDRAKADGKVGVAHPL